MNDKSGEKNKTMSGFCSLIRAPAGVSAVKNKQLFRQYVALHPTNARNYCLSVRE